MRANTVAGSCAIRRVIAGPLRHRLQGVAAPLNKGRNDEERCLRSPNFSERRRGRQCCGGDWRVATARSGAARRTAPAQQDAPAPAHQAAPAPAQSATSAGYSYLNLEEQAFVEALVDHMVPADELTGKGTDLGINIFIDRALAGSWGKGDRLYMQGPWERGTPSQGYQLPFTPADLYRAGIEAANRHSVKTYGKALRQDTADQREDVLAWSGLPARLEFEDGPPARAFSPSSTRP